VSPPSALVRVVAVDGDGVAVGRTLPGRGAWLCAGSEDCLERAVKRSALGRALRAPVAVDAATAEPLRTMLAASARMED
jgi:predicted RNA-binding protein YlxR (DUF448 family)